MSLSMGLATVANYYGARDRREARERDETRFGWEVDDRESITRVRPSAEEAAISGNEVTTARNRAGLETLPGETEATRSGNQLATARNRAGLDTLPGETEAQRTGNELAAANNRAGLETLPAETDNRKRRADVERQQLEGQQQRQGLDNDTLFNQSRVSKLMSEISVEQAPAQIARLRRDNVINQAEAQAVGIFQMGRLIEQGDPQRVMQYLNDMRKADPKIGLRADVAEVTFETDGSGQRVFIARDAQGNDVLRLSKEQMDAINRSVAPPSTTTLSPGQTMVQTDQDGQVNPVYTAPDRATTLPAEARLVEYYVSKGMSTTEAIAQARTLKNMSPENAVFQLYRDRTRNTFNLTPEKSSQFMEEARREVAQLYGLDELPELSPPSGQDAGGSGVNWADWLE